MLEPLFHAVLEQFRSKQSFLFSGSSMKRVTSQRDLSDLILPVLEQAEL